MAPWRDLPNKHRFGLASLLIFMAIVAVALAHPHIVLSLGATIPFFLMGAFVIKFGWCAQRHRLVVRSLTIACGTAMMAAGAWVFSVMLP